jgi:hypothetical protein
MAFDANILSAIAAFGRQIVEVTSQGEVDRNAKIDLMRKVTGLECELEEARDRIGAMWVILNMSGGGSPEVVTFAERLKEALR